ncbi:unnamed protein product [Callosobruchus maculatus]|uniref:Uncharacterized protein n=1 Tax=Callosobruchus maculatus TaxID=64391 RepID=A0A653BI46_CALMS|nr:unnamed protein product [Callosobruchus maculatus]
MAIDREHSACCEHEVNGCFVLLFLVQSRAPLHTLWSVAPVAYVADNNLIPCQNSKISLRLSGCVTSSAFSDAGPTFYRC